MYGLVMKKRHEQITFYFIGLVVPQNVSVYRGYPQQTISNTLETWQSFSLELIYVMARTFGQKDDLGKLPRGGEVQLYLRGGTTSPTIYSHAGVFNINLVRFAHLSSLCQLQCVISERTLVVCTYVWPALPSQILDIVSAFFLDQNCAFTLFMTNIC